MTISGRQETKSKLWSETKSKFRDSNRIRAVINLGDTGVRINPQLQKDTEVQS